MSILRETCHCGHDKSSHHFEPNSKESWDCLAVGCNCHRYVNERDPKPETKLWKPPTHPIWCKCFYCKRTDPPPAAPVTITPLWPPKP